MLQAPELKERLTGEGAAVVGSSPEHAEALVRTELVRWTRLVKQLGLLADGAADCDKVLGCSIALMWHHVGAMSVTFGKYVR